MAYVRDTGKYYVWDEATSSYIESSVVPTKSYTLTVFATPANATIVLEATGFEQEGDSITVPQGTTVNYTVSCEGYVTVSDSIQVLEDTNLTIILEEVQTYTLTINPTPVDAEVVLTAQGYEQQGNSITVQEGTEVRYTVSKKGYRPISNRINVFENTTLEVELEEIPVDEHIHIQLLRGTTNKNEAYIGREGELTYDIEKKNVRVHDGETPGGKIVSADIDNLTIINDNNDKLQSVAKKNQNRANGATTVIYDWEGTLAQYNAQDIEHTHPDWICYINDDVEGGTSVYTKEEIDRELVHKTGYETIAGNKTFANPITISSGDAQVLQLKGIPTTEGQHLRDIVGIDTEDARIAGIRFEKSATEERKISLYACNENNTNLGGIEVKYDTVNETLKTTAVNPEAGSNSKDIATTKWVNGNRSNCITEIPQDIKLELKQVNNLTRIILKAGSIVYAPNGLEADGTTKKFEKIEITSDITLAAAGTGWTNAPHFLFLSIDKSTSKSLYKDHIFSGDTEPSSSICMWYDTANNIIKYKNSDWYTETYSLPICISDWTSEIGYIKINQVFNGFGYIGSTVFALPGVSYLIPDGRNTDGTLKSIEFTITEVDVRTIAPYTGTHLPLCLDNEGKIQYQTYYFEQEENPNTNWSEWYKPSENIIYWKQAEGYDVEDYIQGKFCVVGFFDRNVGVVSNFKPKNTFKSFDYNDISVLMNTLYPVGSIYIGTTNYCPVSILIPGSTWELVAADRSLQGSSSSHVANTTINAGLPNITSSYKEGWLGDDKIYDIQSGAMTFTNIGSRSGSWGHDGNYASRWQVSFDASRSNSIYGSSTTVQPPAYVVNVWRRTS